MKRPRFVKGQAIGGFLCDDDGGEAFYGQGGFVRLDKPYTLLDALRVIAEYRDKLVRADPSRAPYCTHVKFVQDLIHTGGPVLGFYKLRPAPRSIEEMTREELITLIKKIRPKADAYDVALRELGIKKDLIGHIRALVALSRETP